MIKYEGIEKRFFYNIEDVNKILSIIPNVKYEQPDYCSREEVCSLIEEISNFLSKIKVEEKTGILERHETEEEARDYFGPEFIAKFENILSVIDKQHTMLGLHGTHPSVCPQICEEGLKYLSPSINATAVTKDLNLGDGDVKYNSYEELLNWGHKNYKGLVMIAIPYECYYREGLWEHYQETDNRLYGAQDYKIPADFVVGYIDVEGKNIVLNPKYNRNHDYSKLIHDNDIFNSLVVSNDDEVIQIMKEQEQILKAEIKKEEEVPKVDKKEEKVNVESELYKVEEFMGIFNSMTMNYENGISEDRYKYLLKQISEILSGLQKAIPLMKTQEEILAEQSKYSFFDDTPSNIEPSNQISDFGDDIDWDFPALDDNEVQGMKR